MVRFIYIHYYTIKLLWQQYQSSNIFAPEAFIAHGPEPLPSIFRRLNVLPLRARLPVTSIPFSTFQVSFSKRNSKKSMHTSLISPSVAAYSTCHSFVKFSVLRK